MIVVKHKGDFSKTLNFLKRNKKFNIKDLDKFGVEGVLALTQATPVDTGATASSWDYRIVEQDGRISLEFLNHNIVNGIPIAIILQYGHATGTGGWVEGIDYINPALRPIFDKIAKDAWEEVTR